MQIRRKGNSNSMDLTKLHFRPLFVGSFIKTLEKRIAASNLPGSDKRHDASEEHRNELPASRVSESLSNDLQTHKNGHGHRRGLRLFLSRVGICLVSKYTCDAYNLSNTRRRARKSPSITTWPPRSLVRTRWRIVPIYSRIRFPGISLEAHVWMEVGTLPGRSRVSSVFIWWGAGYFFFPPPCIYPQWWEHGDWESPRSVRRKK